MYKFKETSFKGFQPKSPVLIGTMTPLKSEKVYHKECNNAILTTIVKKVKMSLQILGIRQLLCNSKRWEGGLLFYSSVGQIYYIMK